MLSGLAWIFWSSSIVTAAQERDRSAQPESGSVHARGSAPQSVGSDWHGPQRTVHHRAWLVALISRGGPAMTAVARRASVAGKEGGACARGTANASQAVLSAAPAVRALLEEPPTGCRWRGTAGRPEVVGRRSPLRRSIGLTFDCKEATELGDQRLHGSSIWRFSSGVCVSRF